MRQYITETLRRQLLTYKYIKLLSYNTLEIINIYACMPVDTSHAMYTLNHKIHTDVTDDTNAKDERCRDNFGRVKMG